MKTDLKKNEKEKTNKPIVVGSEVTRNLSKLNELVEKHGKVFIFVNREAILKVVKADLV